MSSYTIASFEEGLWNFLIEYINLSKEGSLKDYLLYVDDSGAKEYSPNGRYLTTAALMSRYHVNVAIKRDLRLTRGAANT